MNLESLNKTIEDFSKETHGSTDYFKELIFVRGQQPDQFAPLKFLCKKHESLGTKESLFKVGYVCDAFDLYDQPAFEKWYEHQFSQKLKRTQAKEVTILYMPDNKRIFDAIELVNQSYDVLRNEHIILNNKNLPIQLGEWYAKCVFGLDQVKSTSQRGFDFLLHGKRAEIKVEWGDRSSPKGVKLRKSLADLSDYCIIMYVARNFRIREICFLDSDFVLRKFGGKGHTIFLKDSDVDQYFFSRSQKHLDKVANPSALLKYSTPTFAMKLSESF
ncbi:MAG: hypothetical protein CME60_03380 [Halobacteriovoraceae bacterium]|nr:hypothetical protein [Halobacteriovoraceae bacterium]|tara:strand:+ start:4908 stop:5726 length:819 start_codon:yes stop_codon:yes gene_type:complete